MRFRAWFGAVVVLLSVDRSDAMDAGASVYNDANVLYRRGAYAEAAARYEQLVAQGARNGHVYYNLGNAHFKAGRIGRAILAYERALVLMPGDADAVANLRFVNALKADRESEPDVNFLTRVLRRVYGAFNADGLALFSSVLLFVVCGAVSAVVLVPGRRVLRTVLLVVLSCGLFGSSVLLAFKIYDQEVVQEAVVLEEAVLGRSGPGEDYLQVFTIHEGTKAVIERVEQEWFLVRLSNGIGGWIARASVERI